MQSEIVNIANRSSLTMKGVLCRPDSNENARSISAIYLPGIVLGSTAVHRLAFKVAEQLAFEGVTTLICDHTGVGESEGEFPPLRHCDLVAQVSSGVFVEDTLDMIEWLKLSHSTQKVVLIGHCGGSLTALLTASRHDAVHGLYLISPPLTPMSETKSSLSTQAADEYFSLYRSKLLSLEAWRKLLTGKSNYGTIFETLKKKLSRRRLEAEDRDQLIEMVDQRLFEMFRNVLDTTPVTMIIGDKDPDIEAFKAFSRLGEKIPNLETDILGQTTHGFVTRESLEKLKVSIRNFSRAL